MKNIRFYLIVVVLVICVMPNGCNPDNESVPFPNWGSLDESGNALIPFPRAQEFSGKIERWALETEYPSQKLLLKITWDGEIVASFHVSSVGKNDIFQTITLENSEYLVTQVHINTDTQSGWVTLTETSQ